MAGGEEVLSTQRGHAKRALRGVAVQGSMFWTEEVSAGHPPWSAFSCSFKS